MTARLTPTILAAFPDAQKAIQLLYGSAAHSGAPAAVLHLVHLRASQINGCSACVASGAAEMRKAGASDERLATVAAWRETSYFTPAERAALALAEAATRLADQTDAVPDEVWDEAKAHFNDRALAGIVLWIATTNFFNRLNASVRHPAGQPWF